MSSKLFSQFEKQVNEGGMLANLNPEVTDWICQELKLSSETLSVMDEFGVEAKKKYFEGFIKDMNKKYDTKDEFVSVSQSLVDMVKDIVGKHVDDNLSDFLKDVLNGIDLENNSNIEKAEFELADLLYASEIKLDSNLDERDKIKNGSFTEMLGVTQPKLMYLFDLLADDFYRTKDADFHLACRIFAGFDDKFKDDDKVRDDYQLLVEAFITYLKFKNKSINVYSISRTPLLDSFLNIRLRTLLIDETTFLDATKLADKLMKIVYINANGTLKDVDVIKLEGLMKRILNKGVLVEVVDGSCEGSYCFNTNITSFSKILKRNRIVLETLLTSGPDSYVNFGNRGNYELLIDSVRNMPESLFVTDGIINKADLIFVNPNDSYKIPTSITAEIVKTNKVVKGCILGFANVSDTRNDIFGFVHISPLMLTI